MDNNNKDLITKLEREIWLFEQWLTTIDEEDSDTHKRIKLAYQECILSRKAKLDELESQFHAQQPAISVNSSKETEKA